MVFKLHRSYFKGAKLLYVYLSTVMDHGTVRTVLKGPRRFSGLCLKGPGHKNGEKVVWFDRPRHGDVSQLINIFKTLPLIFYQIIKFLATVLNTPTF
jgi:hypothetical protein